MAVRQNPTALNLLGGGTGFSSMVDYVQCPRLNCVDLWAIVRERWVPDE